jgi:hypothetical protein
VSDSNGHRSNVVDLVPRIRQRTLLGAAPAPTVGLAARAARSLPGSRYSGGAATPAGNTLRDGERCMSARCLASPGAAILASAGSVPRRRSRQRLHAAPGQPAPPGLDRP